jgi:hypothetical protein
MEIGRPIDCKLTRELSRSRRELQAMRFKGMGAQQQTRS